MGQRSVFFCFIILYMCLFANGIKHPRKFQPSKNPTQFPSQKPSKVPTLYPTSPPSLLPSISPTSISLSLPSQTTVPFTPQLLYTCFPEKSNSSYCPIETKSICAQSTKFVVYSFQAPINGTYVFSTNSPLTTCIDTSLLLLPSYLCNDDIEQGVIRTSQIEIQLTKNQQIQALIGSWQDTCLSTQQVSLSVYLATPIPTSKPTSVRPTRRGVSFPPTLAPSFGPPYDIEFIFTGISEHNETIQQIFFQAAQKWTKIIRQGLPGFITLERTRCGIYFPSPRIVNNLLVVVEIAHIDGIGKVLGNSGPCIYDTLNMPRMGTMTFDSADVMQMMNSGIFFNVVLHELGHVLGIGSIWDLSFVSTTLLSTTDGGGFGYLRENGNEQNHQLGRNGNANVEDLGGYGTSRAHWKEAVYGNELMTGYVAPIGIPMPLSILTIGALEDLGYIVDYSQADDFQFLSPPPERRRLRGNQKEKFHSHYNTEEPHSIEIIQSTPKGTI